MVGHQGSSTELLARWTGFILIALCSTQVRDVSCSDGKSDGQCYGSRCRRATPSAKPYKIAPVYDSTVDSLPASQSRLIKNVLLPAVSDWLSQAVQVQGSSVVTLSRACPNATVHRFYDSTQVYCDRSCAPETFCGTAKVPSGHLKRCYFTVPCSPGSSSGLCYQSLYTDGPGVNGHLALYVTASNTRICVTAPTGSNDTVMMHSMMCEQEPSLDRPVAASLNFCPLELSTLLARDYKSTVNQVLRQLIHVMGFNFTLFGYFRSSTGKALTPRDNYGLPHFASTGYYVTDLVFKHVSPKWPTATGNAAHSVYRLVTPAIKREVQSHFGCSQLDGAEVELQAGHFNLWEERLFHGDVMSSGNNFASAVVSRVTLALLEDTGWYTVNYSYANELAWGKNLGCAFVLQNCQGWRQSEKQLNRPATPFCSTLQSTDSVVCSADHRMLAKCNMKLFDSDIPAQYQYFKSYPGVSSPLRLGGRNIPADYCPMLQEFTLAANGQVSSCANMANARVFADSVQHFGQSAYCVQHQGVWTRTSIASQAVQLTNLTAGCYKFSCHGDKLRVQVGNHFFTCQYDGQWLLVSATKNGVQHKGTLVCPKFSIVCDGYGCPGDCSFRGRCSRGICLCHPGYYGNNCSSTYINHWNDCGSSPCQHNGTCSTTASGYHCACMAGYTGSDCAVNIDECASLPCLNGAKCIDEINAYHCVCPTTHTGVHCETDISLCKSQPCQYGGTCLEVSTGTGLVTVCRCPANYYGQFCESKLASGNPCQTRTCRNGGTCRVNDNGRAVCDCRPGYRGVLCHIDIDYCVENPCLNGATCFEHQANRSCQCTSDFYGVSCENKIIRCSPTLCQGGGTCTDTAFGGVCTCAPSRTGRYCTSQLYCFSSPCQHSSTCSETPDVGYNCTCSPGYTGVNCQTEIDECQSSPCSVHGQCVDAIASFSCRCSPGYTGQRCEVEVNECDSQPCMNGGRCTDSVNAFRCSCALGYTGARCEQEINECMSMPCRHGGTCHDRIARFNCSCAAGYTGHICQTELDECSSGPCSVNSYRCVDEVAAFKCICKPGFTDPLCSTNIDECSSSPCVHGKCIDGTASYRCSCDVGYNGSRCNVNINDCVPFPCQNGGTCVDGVAMYSCNCPVLWTGRRCQTQWDPCSNMPCYNGGMCKLDKATSAPFCSCPIGFGGLRCERSSTSSVTPLPPTVKSPSSTITTGPGPTTRPSPATTAVHCSSFGCLNNGSCLPSTGRCRCIGGYSGQRCELPPSGCAAGYCLNGATCTSDSSKKIVCRCPNGYFGDRCQLSPCFTSPCGVASRCRVLSRDAHECVCSTNHTGPACSISVLTNHCLSSPCLNLGTCVNFPSRFVCSCASGFSGDRCEVNIDECASNPCKNSAHCSDLINSYACTCPVGLTGRFCEEYTNVCSSSPCKNSGICKEKSGAFVCSCLSGFTGETCEVAAGGTCKKQRCLNDATLTTHPNGSVSCLCKNGFSGSCCETVTDACSYHPCLNGGSCLASQYDPSWHLCHCPSAYSGPRCEFAAVCFPNPCQNGGVCLSDSSSSLGFFCDCTYAFVGDLCEIPNDPCASRPCGNDGLCSRTLLGTYVCRCNFPNAGPVCNDRTSMASYDRAAYSRLASGAASLANLDVQLSIRPVNGDGLLLFLRADKGSTSDFISVGFVGGHVLVSYQLGGRRGSLLGSQLLSVNEWHSVDLAVDGRKLSLMSDSTVNLGTSEKSAKSIPNVERIVLVGGAQAGELQRSGFLSNFAGCVSKVVINSKQIDLSGSTAYHEGVEPCVQTGCERQGSVCLNGGTCVAQGNTHMCACTVGYAGSNCSQVVTFRRPQFLGVSHLSLKPVMEASGRFTRVEATFRPEVSDGVILYAAQDDSGMGDFMSLSLTNRMLEFRFDCGSGVGVLRAAKPLTLWQWHNVTVERTGMNGWLAVDREPKVSGHSQAPFQELDLLFGLFVGGWSPFLTLPSDVAASAMPSRFTGSISSLTVNRKRLDLTSASSDLVGGAGVVECGASSFCKPPCQNGSVCRVDPAGTPVCSCVVGSSLNSCSQDLSTVSTPSFSGFGYLVLDVSRFVPTALRSEVKLSFRPTATSCQLFFLGQVGQGLAATDYISVSLVDAVLIVRFDLGTGAATLKGNVRLPLNAWHQLHLTRTGPSLSLQVNGHVQMIKSPGLAEALNGNPLLYLGGLPPDATLPLGVGSVSGFRGCLGNIAVGKQPLSSLQTWMTAGEGVSGCIAPQLA